MTYRVAFLASALLILALGSSAQEEDTPMVISGAPDDLPPYIYSRLRPSGDAANDSMVSSRGSLELWLHGDLYMGHIKLREIVNFTMAHIHTGDNSTSGPILTWSFPLYASGLGAVPRVSGVFRFPFVVAANVFDMDTLENQGYYFNVHTIQYPGGEIRGQLISVNETQLQDAEQKRRMH